MQTSGLKTPIVVQKWVAETPRSRFLGPYEYATAPSGQVLAACTLLIIKRIKSTFNNNL